MTYNVIDSVWFGVIGIVRVRTEYDGDKFYIGIGGGSSEHEDEQHIAAYGSPYYPEALKTFFKR